ncbi:MAG: hydrogenase maturation protease [Candidatus Omnitrophica bacterium]|nr:hydrogenase maturation protease [Candidatus Omnitrophota bacterium]
MIPAEPRILLIGYGNPGRLDDGLGPAVAAAVEKLALPNVTIESDYQLTVEDASQIAEHDIVIFCDAAVSGAEPFDFFEIAPKKDDISFSTHSIDPSAVLGLACTLFQAKTKAYVLAIRGYDFNEFGEKLSDKAQNNLLDAFKFLEKRLKTRDFSQVNKR